MNEAEASCILTFDHARNAGRCFPSFFASPKKNPMIAITYSFYPAKTVIVKQDTPANIVYLIEHGLVKLVRENSKSNEVIIGFRHRDWLIGAPTILLGKPYNFTIIAVVPTRLREIPKKDFQELIKKDEQLS
jgi:CRP-like cAMP-binding protein